MERITVPANISNLPDVISSIEAFLEQIDCPIKAQTQIEVAVDEVFTNIASYAYDGSDGLVTIDADMLEGEEGIKLTFTDQGKAYNPLEKEDPDITLSAEERPIGGLGIFIVKKTMDDVVYSYENDSNILSIIKRFK